MRGETGSPDEIGATSLREESFKLLDKLCRDSLEVPLANVLQYPGGDIGDTFARLFDILEELTADAR